MIKNGIFYILVLVGVFSKAQSPIEHFLNVHTEKKIPYVSVTEARMFQLQDNALFLDARERKEYEVSAIPSAKFIGYSTFSSEDITKNIANKDQLIIVYCSLGIRSSNIAKKLKNLGFSNVKNLYGGIFEWKNNGYPVLNSEGEETEKVHTFSKAWEKYLESGIKIN
ncbi:MAG: rhodanese-like domain-containing protein [Flavobacteriaceae bacterium]